MSNIYDSNPATEYASVTLGASDLAGGICRAILCDTAGVLNLTQPNGTLRENVPVIAGYNPLKAKRINTPTSGSAPTSVWALY